MKNLGLYAWTAFIFWCVSEVAFWIFIGLLILTAILNVIVGIKNEIDEYKQLKEASDEYERIKKEIKKMKRESENEN